MKTFLLLALGLTVLLVWFRSGRRWGGSSRANLIALGMFGLTVGAMIGLIVLAARLF